MDGHLMNQKLSNLSHLSDERWKKLKKYLRTIPFVAGSLFTPKRDNATQGYREGCEIQRIKEFNPITRPHSMDSEDSFQSQIEQDHHDWETNYRRDYIDGDRYSLLETCEMFDDKEEAWNDIRRRERMEQACYD